MTRKARRLFVLLAIAASHAIAGAGSAAAQASDTKAVEIARQVLEKMGGEQAWNQTRFICWNFFDRRHHCWDKWSGNDRIDGEDNRVSVVNSATGEGRVWTNGQEITDPAARKEALEQAHRQWVNDAYWLIMPYKLLDPGVILAYEGEEAMEDGRAADVLELTFESVGYTPQNRYLVWVARETGLVEQWAHFREATDAEPNFVLPWTGWERFGRIMLSTDRGRGFDWKIKVYDALPESIFTSPAPISLP